jgi:TonB family protein
VLMSVSALAQTEPESDAATAAADSVELEIFKGPLKKDVKPAMYPVSEHARGNEGWVTLNFMISPQGKPYEVVVTGSSGIKAFEQSALEAAEKWTFEPASIGGTPIDAAHNIKVRFYLTDPAKGAREAFVKSYRKLMRAISANDKSTADAELEKLQAKNLYEDAFLNLGKYNYYRVWGTVHQQTQALSASIADEDTPRYLPKDQFSGALQLLFPLQVSAQEFAGALDTWRRLQTSGIDKELLARWKASVDDIEALRTDNRSYQVGGTIQNGSSWFYKLFKSRFQITVRSGQLSEIKLRCDKKYIFFRYEADLQYKVGNKLGNCAMELVGEPGTTFDLIQS